MYLKQEGFLNIALFYAWFAIIFSFFVYNKKTMEAAADNVVLSPIPTWLDILFDVCVMISFVYFGYIFLPIMYFIHICNGQHARQEAQKIVKSRTESKGDKVVNKTELRESLKSAVIRNPDALNVISAVSAVNEDKIKDFVKGDDESLTDFQLKSLDVLK